MCNCRNMMRDAATEGYGAALPLSNHHPKCEDYELKEFVRIAYDGTPVIMTKDDAQDYINDLEENGADATEYTQMKVSMTQDQFDNLKEFQGW